jgi:alpha 1,3-glucosidase
MFITTQQGTDYQGDCWPGNSSWFDYLRPEVRAYWASCLAYEKYAHSTEHLHVWNDMNEPSVFSGPETTMHGDAMHGAYEHREVHNIYGQYMQKATQQGLCQRSGGTARPFVLSRAFYAGSQKFGAIWTGDNGGTWPYLKVSVPMCLSIALGGLSFCGADIGGFFGDPEPLLVVRWHQLAAFLPFMRAHSHHDSRRREPWLFGEPTLTHIRQALQMRYSLLPYLYTAFYRHSTAGTPVIRPLFMEFADDPAVEEQGHHFMLGPALLVVPIVEAAQQHVQVYLPSALWYDFYDWRLLEAGHHEVAVKDDRIPVFVKGGTVIFRQERLRPSSELMENDPYSVYIALDSVGKASGEVYVDDGKTYAYEQGHCLLAALQFDNDCASFAVQGSYSRTNSIDKVVIAGLRRPVKDVSIRARGQQWRAGFYMSAGAVVVKCPGVSVAEPWQLQYTLSD